MAWPSAVKGSTETTLAADIAQLRCDPNVKSIFIQATATDCSSCPTRMADIVAGKATWETDGAVWILVVKTLSGHVADAAAAASYATRQGYDFGWYTNDGDNTAGAFTVADSSNYAAVPWTAVIRPSTGEVVCDEPDTAYLNLTAISGALADNPEADLSAYCTNH
jgi:hypothetical protein